MVSAPPADGDLRWSADLAGGALMDMGCYGIHMMQRLASLCGGAPCPKRRVSPWIPAESMRHPRRF